jgi:hypothetical protein
MFWKKAVVATTTFLVVSSFVVLTPMVAGVVVLGLIVWTVARVHVWSRFSEQN